MRRRYVIRVAHSSDSPRASLRFNLAPYTGRVLQDDVALSGDLSQSPGPKVRTFLYRNTDSSRPISVVNSGTDTTELYVFYPLLSQGLRDQGYGSLTVRASDAEKGVWILQVSHCNSHHRLPMFQRMPYLPVCPNLTPIFQVILPSTVERSRFSLVLSRSILDSAFAAYRFRQISTMRSDHTNSFMQHMD